MLDGFGWLRAPQAPLGADAQALSGMSPAAEDPARATADGAGPTETTRAALALGDGAAPRAAAAAAADASSAARADSADAAGAWRAGGAARAVAVAALFWLQKLSAACALEPRGRARDALVERGAARVLSQARRRPRSRRARLLSRRVARAQTLARSRAEDDDELCLMTLHTMLNTSCAVRARVPPARHKHRW